MQDGELIFGSIIAVICLYQEITPVYLYIPKNATGIFTCHLLQFLQKIFKAILDHVDSNPAPIYLFHIIPRISA